MIREYIVMFLFFWVFVGGVMCIFNPIKYAILFGLGSAVGQVIFRLAIHYIK